MTLTNLNLYALQKALNDSSDGIIRFVGPTDVNHIRRCVKAGALEQTDERVGRGYAWKLSESGRAQLHTRNVHNSKVVNYLIREEALRNLENGY